MHSNISNPKKKSEKTQFRNFKDLILFLSLFIKKLLLKALLISFILLRESEKHLYRKSLLKSIWSKKIPN